MTIKLQATNKRKAANECHCRHSVRRDLVRLQCNEGGVHRSICLLLSALCCSTLCKCPPQALRLCFGLRRNSGTLARFGRRMVMLWCPAVQRVSPAQCSHRKQLVLNPSRLSCSLAPSLSAPHLCLQASLHAQERAQRCSLGAPVGSVFTHPESPS